MATLLTVPQSLDLFGTDANGAFLVYAVVQSPVNSTEPPP